jgi:predicted nucleic acid-binding protein
MIVDSTVLIALGNLGKIQLINNCKIPEKVLEEISHDPTKNALLHLTYQKVIPSKNSQKKSLNILGDKFESGDSDIVAILIDIPSSIIATDDRRLRNVCRALGGKVTGTLGIIMNALKEEKISKKEALALISTLHNIGFRMSLELYQTIKEKIERM